MCARLRRARVARQRRRARAHSFFRPPAAAHLSLPSPRSRNAQVPGNAVDNSDTLKALSKAVAESVGKPEQWVMVSLTTDKPMVYGGTELPCAYGELISIGAIGGEKNKAVRAVCSEAANTRSRAEQSRAEQSRAEQSRAESEQSRAESGESGQRVNCRRHRNTQHKNTQRQHNTTQQHQISGAIAAVLAAKLKVDPARFYLKFYDAERSNFGWNGSTF